MAYIPKSKIKLHNATGNLVYKINGKRYSGPYIHTSEGKFYAGHDNVNLGLELVAPQDSPSSIHSPYRKEFDKYFNHSSTSRKYNSLSKKTSNFLKNKKSLPVFKNIPNDRDYKRGFFVRYFARRINDYDYYEISESSYISITTEDGIYDHHLYEVGNIVWKLKGKNIHKINTDNIKSTERKFPHLAYLFPVVNEYAAVLGIGTEENLNTTGGELYYSDGTEYIGPYHIHPSMGPMEGATHQDTPHVMLFWTNELPEVPNQSYEDFLHNYNKMDCWKCIMLPNGDYHISSFRQSSLIGCPSDSYATYQGANENCPGRNEAPLDDIRVVDEMPNSSIDYMAYVTGSEYFGGFYDPDNPYGNIPGSSGGGTSGGGGGGY